MESDITDHSILFFIFYFKHTNVHNTNTKPFVRNTTKKFIYIVYL